MSADDSKNQDLCASICSATNDRSAVCGLDIPHTCTLMCTWYKDSTDGGELLKALKSAIVDRCVVVREDCSRFKERLRKRCSEVARYICKASGRKRESFLLNSTVIDVLHGELVAVNDYAEMLELLDRITLQCNGHEKEIAELHKQITSMAKSMTSELRNHGQPINEVSARQARRKLLI